MISDLLSEKAKDELFHEISKAIDDLAEIKANQIQKRYLNKKEACEYIGVNYNNFSSFQREGRIKPIRIEGFSRDKYDRKELDRFMESYQL